MAVYPFPEKLDKVKVEVELKLAIGGPLDEVTSRMRSLADALRGEELPPVSALTARLKLLESANHTLQTSVAELREENTRLSRENEQFKVLQDSSAPADGLSVPPVRQPEAGAEEVVTDPCRGCGPGDSLADCGKQATETVESLRFCADCAVREREAIAEDEKEDSRASSPQEAAHGSEERDVGTAAAGAHPAVLRDGAPPAAPAAGLGAVRHAGPAGDGPAAQPGADGRAPEAAGGEGRSGEGGDREVGPRRLGLPGLPGLYLLVDAEVALSRNHGSFVGERDITAPNVVHRARCVHVISTHAGGEVRGYYLIANRLHVRLPSHMDGWPEVDAAVAKALGATATITEKPNNQEKENTNQTANAAADTRDDGAGSPDSGVPEKAGENETCSTESMESSGTPVAGEAGPASFPADEEAAPSRWFWIRHVELDTWHLYVEGAESAHCDEPLPESSFVVEPDNYDPLAVRRDEKICDGCSEAPVSPEVFEPLKVRLAKVAAQPELPLSDATKKAKPAKRQREAKANGPRCKGKSLANALCFRPAKENGFCGRHQKQAAAPSHEVARG